MTRSRKLLVLTGMLMMTTAPALRAQWVTTHEQFYLPGDFNWQFRSSYPAADRLFNAFDYGHAILYELLWTRPGAAASLLEDKEYDFITRTLLVQPPKLPLEEAAIEIAYAKLVPEAKQMFDWAHLLHRQIYDVWADERMAPAQKDAKVEELLRYYKSRPDLAFSSLPKTMELMEGQPYSLAFRKKYPKFNGLIWAYHWLQVGLYEPLVTGKNSEERQTGVLAAVARFRQMIENPPTDMPRIMPMTAAIAPAFAARYPEAAIIFDNLHSMHDVVSDILANPAVPRNQKRARIIEAARRYRDNTSYIMSVAEWKDMSQMMGVENMGGQAVGFLPGFPKPTAERGAVMADMDHSKMTMPAAAAKDSDNAGVDHSKMHMNEPAKPSADLMEMHMLMLADSVIRKRMHADPKLHEMMHRMMSSMPAEHRAMMHKAMSDSAGAGGHDQHVAKPPAKSSKSAARKSPSRKTVAAKPPAKKASAKKPTKKRPVKKADPMAGMDHSKHK